MFNYRAIIIVLFFSLAWQCSVKCQSQADEKLLLQLKDKLNLDSTQVNSIRIVFKDYAFQLDSLNQTIKKIQTSDNTEDEISMKSSVLFKERKDLKDWKSTQLSSHLTATQKTTYQKEILFKTKPVLHYGHDKANCKTCEKPNPFGIK